MQPVLLAAMRSRRETLRMVSKSFVLLLLFYNNNMLIINNFLILPTALSDLVATSQQWNSADHSISDQLPLRAEDTLVRSSSSDNSVELTQPSIPPGSVNEYQLRLRRQRQVWFIPLADERGVCR